MRSHLKTISYSLAMLTLCLLGTTHAESPTRPNRTALDDYVAKEDSTFSWKLVKTTETPEGQLFAIELTSQTWRSTEDVDRPVWKHWLMVARPKEVKSTTGMLFISGGSHRDTPPDGVESSVIQMARLTGSIVAEVKNIPNQPTYFKELGRKTVEDDFIGFTWSKYMKTKDPTWPARLPMVKSAVRAMDALQQFAASAECGNVKLEKFAVAGGSKRGWTTWCTAAVDPRVCAICPIVIDVLNVRKSMRNHVEAYGFWAHSVGDYVRHKIALQEDDPAYIDLLKIEDPYSYKDRLTMPKYVLNAAGDQFFTPDSSRFYYHDLVGERLLRYVPNTDHSLRDSDARESLAAYYDTVVKNLKRPEYSWSFESNGAIRVDAKGCPKSVKIWQANNPKARDFRLEKIGKAYTSQDLSPSSAGTYVAEITPPKEGWTAFFVELTYDVGSRFPLKVTTDVRILPDTHPFKGIRDEAKLEVVPDRRKR